MLVFNETEEWLLGCPAEVGKLGFESTGESWRGHPILWNPESLILSDKHLPYDQIKLSMVGTVGIHTDERIGEQKPVLIVQEWEALRKNHPGFHESPIEEWLGVFIHEAFHARQMWNPRVRAVVKRWDEEKRPIRVFDSDRLLIGAIETLVAGKHQ